MTSLELYQKFHLLLNSNVLFQNVKIEKQNFVLIFNREKDRWLSKKLEEFNSTDEIFDLQSVYIQNKQLEEYSKYNNFVLYKLPDNYFQYVNSYSNCSKGNLKSVVVNYFTKPKDELELFKDALNSPSFEFEESLCNISDDKLAVYFSDYQINTTYLSYYKEIENIDLEGYIDVNGAISKTKNIDLANIYKEQILDMCVTETMRQYKDQLGFQISKERENTNL